MMKKIKKYLISFTLSLLCLFMCLPCSVMTAYADGISVDGGYTSVLDDLRKDEKFTETDYPVVENDYTLQVIQIAESVDNELFVYVYQPNPEHGKYVASSINISATLHNALEIKNYGLSLINYDGVFQKYLVTGLTLPSGTTRYYDVVSIYRVFDENIDEGLDDDNGNTINEVVFEVAKQYTISDTENGTIIKVADTDIVYITDKYVGFVRYQDGFYLQANRACDSHYIAFSTDRPIDNLYEADVYYTTQSFKSSYEVVVGSPGPIIEYGKVLEDYAYLNYTQSEEYKGGGWWANTYTFDRIQTTEEFLKSEDREFIFELGLFNMSTTSKLTDEGLQNIKDSKWILRFAETDYSFINTPTYIEKQYTIVGNVSILRLKFETDGVVYNLGVVDNKQSGNLVPDNVTKTELKMADWFKIVIALLALILVLYVLGPFLPIIFSFIGGILKLALKIITLPFRLLFGGRRR